MVRLPNINATNEEVKVLRLARKKKTISCKDVNYWLLESLMHKGALNKYFPKNGRNAGWPLYKLTRRAVKLLDHYDAQK